jgi:uncharacterized protein DUF5947
VTGRGLRRFRAEPERPARPSEPVEVCEMCGNPVDPEHGHVADLQHRSIICACRACHLLFTRDTAGGGRYRAIPDRYLCDPDRPVGRADWDALGIPVGAAFFLRDDSGAVNAFYPSPAGATECLLDLDAWADLGARRPLLAAAQPQVEAILIRATKDRVETFLVPIDACYRLVGTVRRHWQGFDGGQEATDRVEEFFGDIGDRARPIPPEG